MKSCTLFALGLLIGSADARAQNAALPPLHGLTISLSSSHQTVALPPPEKPAAKQRLDAISVLATLRNRSVQPVEVAFTDLDAARGKFVFSLYREEDDALLWTSLGQGPARVAARVSETSLRLPHKTAWTSAARVPLQFEGEWLAAGKYRIEAVLAGSPSVFAALGFEVTAAEPPAIKSGIRGLVLMPALSNQKAPPVAGATVVIESLKYSSHSGSAPPPETGATALLPPFLGSTDSEGRFTAPLAPGDYLVTATWRDDMDFPHSFSGSGGGAVSDSVSNLSLPAFTHSGTARVTVKAGAMSAITIQLGRRGPIIDPPVLAQTLVLATEAASAQRFIDADGTAKIRVQASGTVPHPGYRNARLVASLVIPMIAPADGGGLMVLNFAVDPPDPNLFYPMVIATVEATAELPDNGETVIWINAKNGRTTLTLPAAGEQ